MRRFSGWFNGLSGLGKTGVILGAMFGSVVVASAAAAPFADNPKPAPQQQAVPAQTEPQREEKTETTTEAVPCAQESYNDAALAQGQTRVTQGCVNGEKTNTFKVVYLDGKEIERTKTGDSITKAPVSERTAMGTKVPSPPPSQPKCDPNYSGCVPIVSYDLDCPDIGFRVIVRGTDKHGFDGDGDGVGCESY